jgi:uncharacterized protein YjiK
MSMLRVFIITFLFSSAVLACKTVKKKNLQAADFSRYDLQNPVVIKLPDGLTEISGIVFYPKDTSVFAIEDEDGMLYKIYLNRKDVITKWRFDNKHDFEDIVLHDSVFYVLISNGNIESIHFGDTDSVITSKSKFEGGGKTVNEFEAMYYDDSLQQIVMLCKDCDGDGSKTVSAWGYNISKQAYTSLVYAIDIEPIAKKLGVDKLKLRPSAAAINPVTNELYILSSLSKLIVVTDRKGKFIDLYELDPGIYTQSEGIAFTADGDLIISNEGQETELQNILIIKNKKKGL